MSSCDSSKLKIKNFQFEWAVVLDQWSEVFPQSIANEDIPQMKALLVNTKDCRGLPQCSTLLKIIPQTKNVPFYAKFNVFLFSRLTKEKVKIIESRTVFTNDSASELGSYHFPINTEVLLLDVSLAYESKHNEDELSATESVQEIESKQNENELSVVKPIQDIPNNLINDMKGLYVSKECHDVTLTVNNREFKAHKAILIARSPVFAAMFQQEHQMISVNLTDTAGDVFEELLRYMYTGTVMNLDAKAEDLLAASEKYKMRNLKLKCEESLFTEISIEKAVHILILADKHKANDLKTKTLDYIVKNACAVMNMDEWKNLAKTHAHLIAETCSALALEHAA